MAIFTFFVRLLFLKYTILPIRNTIGKKITLIQLNIDFIFDPGEGIPYTLGEGIPYIGSTAKTLFQNIAKFIPNAISIFFIFFIFIFPLSNYIFKTIFYDTQIFYFLHVTYFLSSFYKDIYFVDSPQNSMCEKHLPSNIPSYHISGILHTLFFLHS